MIIAEEYPKHWQARRIEDVIKDVKSGFAINKNKLLTKGVPQLRAYNITANLALDLSRLVYVPHTPDIESYFLRVGDVLFNNTNSKELVGKTAIATNNLDACYSNHIYRIRVNESIIEPMWFALWIQRYWTMGKFFEICRRWIGQAGVNLRMLKELEILVPPLQEQRKMIDRIKNLMISIEELKKLRISAIIESEAVMHSLMSSIFDETFETTNENIELSRCFNRIGSGTTPRKGADNYVENGVPFIKVEHITKDGRVQVTQENPRINRKLHETVMKRSQVSGKSILVNIVGPPLGKVGLISDDIKEANINQAIVALRDPTSVTPEFVWYCLRSPKYNQKLKDLGIGIRQANINISQIREFKIPVPAISVQNQIVYKLNDVRMFVENLISFQRDSMNRIEALNPSILDAMSKGRLLYDGSDA